MRKSTLFISAVLTTFVMAMLAGVASAYQGIVSNTQSALFQPQVEMQTGIKSVSETIPAEAPSKDQVVSLTPEEAAGLAAQVLGRDDLYSVEITDLNGESVFMVTFSSGDLVYVSLDGQIRSIGKVQVETVVVNTGGGGGGGGDGGNVSQQSFSSQHDEEDDHEEHDEHESQEYHDEHEEHDD